MIVDSHMHVGHEDLISSDLVAFMKARGVWEATRGRLSPEGVIGTLDDAGIDRGVVFPLSFIPPSGAWQTLNEMTAGYVQAYPERLTGYAVIYPGDPTASLRELERAVRDLGLRGLKVHPSMQAFYPNDEALFPIYEYAQEAQIPVLCHTGATTAHYADKFSHPLLLDEVAVRFPRLILILAHAGRPWYQDAALLMRKHPNVFCDLSANVGRTGGTALLEMVLINLKLYADGLKRLLFGSDFPIFDPAKSLDDLRSASRNSLAERMGLPGVGPDELEGILSKNALDVLARNTAPLMESGK